MTESISIAEYWALQKKAPKYGNDKTTVGALSFDSHAEANRYGELRLMEVARLISDLKLQPSYELQPAFKDREGTQVRAVRYVGDFAYVENGVQVVEDVKGTCTAVFLLKAKLFAYRFPDIELRIINQ